MPNITLLSLLRGNLNRARDQFATAQRDLVTNLPFGVPVRPDHRAALHLVLSEIISEIQDRSALSDQELKAINAIYSDQDESIIALADDPSRVCPVCQGSGYYPGNTCFGCNGSGMNEEDTDQ